MLVRAALALIVAASAVATRGPNPFARSDFYVNPTYQAEIAASLTTCTDATACANLKIMQNAPSAFWVDTQSKIFGDNSSSNSVAAVLADAASRSPAPLVVFIVYDLPNRDCAAHSSNGELCCAYNADRTCDYGASGDCNDGIAEYQTKYVNALVSLFARYHTQVPIVAIVEPDSLPNLATNQGNPHCGNVATNAAYKTGVAYAVQQIAALAPSVAIYLDAGHGGWLGWESNAQAFAQLVSSLGVTQHLRGFATNTAGYQPLGVACAAFDWCLPNQNHSLDACCADACKLASQYNPAVSELQYVQVLAHYFQPTFAAARFVIDTGRNGVADMRSNCANWCNVRGAGAGRLPTNETALPLVDAYFWLKTPGECDGCTQTLPNGSACPRFDTMCGSVDSLGSARGEPRAPEAGRWFDYEVQMLARNAHF